MSSRRFAAAPRLASRTASTSSTAIAHGIGPERLSLTDAYGPMPAFADRIGAEDMTALVNYLRAAFAPPGVALTPLTVAEVQRIAGE